ncbi:hypothetical protein B0T10DRAFT_581160 [Thelonectria olida]|uniref:Xylanolytic transcriptional activator regulatory domain-containing protein n=1 Tax=Thelonectria olida TaxID=1576542 RepID=A0A9P8VVD9_9HYPO|nr:hypothetical protein B0T10DRAFT_581160 [Thelonectria olida]
MFKFISDNTGGVGAKRKLSQRTCDSCKKRHKRCLHSQGSAFQVQLKSRPSFPCNDEDSRVVDERAVDETPSKGTRSRSEAQVIQSSLPAQPGQPISEDRNLRFIGNLSPEASFLAARNRVIRGDDQRPELGVWLGQREDEPASDDLREGSNIEEPVGATSTSLPTPSGLQAFFPRLQKECMSVLPPDNKFGLISKVFYSKFVPLFPILYEQDFKRLNNVETIALRQCICLIAALDPCLKSHLMLPHSKTVLSGMEFRSCIATALESTLYMGLIRDKMVLLQVSALMAFYVDKPSSSEISSFYCTQAVNLAQTLGLHLGWPDEGENPGKSRRIFWCVWTLDRLNAATNGRPTSGCTVNSNFRNPLIRLL